MPEIDNLYDDEMAIRLRAEQADPTVMYLVVRKATGALFHTLAVDAARATRRCLAELGDTPAWQGAFAEWRSRSFRKVTLRAEAREWEALLLLDHVREEDILCLPPRRKSACERPITRLQAHKGSVELPELVVGEGLHLAVNATIEMSAGKALAQIAHGALMRGGAASVPVHVGVVDRARWKELANAHEVAIVRDAGLTEVTPGSETVMAFLAE